MAHTRLQNYTNMIVGEHGILTCNVVVVVLLLLLFVLTTQCESLIIFGHMFCPNMLNITFTWDSYSGNGVNMKWKLIILVPYLMSGLTYI